MSLPLVCPYYTDPIHCFDDKTRKPCTGQCGHAICLQCITVLEITRCPVCELNGAFSRISVNYVSIDLIKACRKTFRKKLKKWVDTKTPDAGLCTKLFNETQLLCSLCVEPVKIPRICLTCDEEILFKRNRWQWKQSNVVALKLLQRVMCSNCAIENHGDKEHEIAKHNLDKKSKKLITMAVAQKVLDMFKATIENKKGVIDCFLRRLKFEIIGQNLLKLFEKLEYAEEWECGYLRDLIKKELIKKYMENVDEKMLDLLVPEGNAVCDCSRFHEKLETFSRRSTDVDMHRTVGIKPGVFDSGCPLYSWEYLAGERWKYSISEKQLSATRPPNEISCPLCAYNGYSQHQKKDFLLGCGKSIIEKLCRTEMVTLDKCCLRCLDRLNDCEFLFSCKHRKKSCNSSGKFLSWYREKKQSNKRKSCYQNCFMKDSSIWNFVIVNHMMADNNLYDVIMYEIDQTDGFVGCQLQKVRMKETVNELYNGLRSVHLWEYFDHWSKPIEMDKLLKSFKQQWDFFRIGNGEQNAARQCECTMIWNKIQENKQEKKKYEELKTAMIDMARYSMTEEIHGCPMEYSHGIELNKDVMDQLEDGFESTGQKSELTLARYKQMKCLIKKIASNIFPFAHLHCRNEEKQLFDNQIHQPYTGSCGHTVCLVCVEKTPNGDCPICGKGGSFEGHLLDEELMREIETIKRNAWEIFKVFWNSEAASSGACSKCNKSFSELYLCGINNLTTVNSSRKRLRMKSTADVLKFSGHVLCQECASAQAYATEKVNSIPFWKNHLKKANGIFLLELLDDENGGGENCGFRQVEIQKTRRTLLKVLEELNYADKIDCGYDKELIKQKLIEALIESIDQNMKQVFMSEENLHELIRERNCPMCVMTDFLDCARNTSERNCNEWISVFEHSWSVQSPRFEKCCTRCLLYLNNRYSASCQTRTEVTDRKKMSDAISEGIEENQLKNFHQVLAITHCNDCNRLVNDKEIWRNLIIREYFFCLLQTMTEGLSKTIFPCHLHKIRIYNLAFHFLSEVCDVWLMNNQNWIVCWRFIKTSNMLENLIIQLKKLSNEMERNDIGVKCECTRILEGNQNLMKKFGHEDCEEKRKCQGLKDSMEEMARFSLEKNLDGCPMKYDHGIELDEEIFKQLKEATGSEAETNKNKCLCVGIDSLGPDSKTSGANLDEIVPLFINWWRIEASYPHLPCHVCVERLDLIHNKLGTPSGSYNCDLRNKNMLKPFEELATFIRKFQLLKGRVSESDMEKMTKVFDNFISHWDLFQFVSDSDQPLLLPGSVCFCKKILGTGLSLRHPNASLETEEECKCLMKMSKILAEFNSA